MSRPARGGGQAPSKGFHAFASLRPSFMLITFVMAPPAGYASATRHVLPAEIGGIYKAARVPFPARRNQRGDNYAHPMGDAGVYEGRNPFLRWWPKLLVVIAVGVVLLGWNHTVQWATLLCLLAYVHGRWLPWRFTIGEDGIGYQPESEGRLRRAFTGFGYDLTG